jgi:uncharacterized protein DUF4394/thrombospondin type 3 repeat protein
MRVRAGLAGLLVGAAVMLGPFIASAAAEPAAAIAPGNVLVLFDTLSPATVTSRAITGLGASESVRGIDVRPATGQVYIFTVAAGSVANSTIKTYTLDTSTGAATFVGISASLAGAGDFATGSDFNPAVDRMRYVNAADENARINPTNGMLAADDADLTPAATTTLIAEAYDRNRAGATVNTLYAIDRNDSSVSVQGGVDGAGAGGPNGGVVTDLAPLGFTLNAANDGGFDVSPTGTAFAALTSSADNLTRLYFITLPTAVTATPAATAVGLIGTGTFEVRTLTILEDDRDGDGRLTSADNCPTVANADQANLDGDAFGDVCDDDDDGDGLSDATEAVLGTNPRSTDSDGDGKADNLDSCPTLGAATANGCPDLSPPLPAALSFRLTGVPSRITLQTLRTRGVSLTVEPNQPASFFVELLGSAKRIRLADVGDVVLGEKRLARAAGRRTTRLTIPRSQRSRLRHKARLRLRVTATDALGRKTVITRRLTIR